MHKSPRMVKVSEGNKVVYEGPDKRFYDSDYIKSHFGITVGDFVKAVPIIIACALFYAKNENFQKNQVIFNQQVLISMDHSTKVLENLNNYLSASTGKQFKDGRPY